MPRTILLRHRISVWPTREKSALYRCSSGLVGTNMEDNTANHRILDSIPADHAQVSMRSPIVSFLRYRLRRPRSTKPHHDGTESSLPDCDRGESAGLRKARIGKCALRRGGGMLTIRYSSRAWDSTLLWCARRCSRP